MYDKIIMTLHQIWLKSLIYQRYKNRFTKISITLSSNVKFKHIGFGDGMARLFTFCFQLFWSNHVSNDSFRCECHRLFEESTDSSLDRPALLWRLRSSSSSFPLSRVLSLSVTLESQNMVKSEWIWYFWIFVKLSSDFIHDI